MIKYREGDSMQTYKGNYKGYKYTVSDFKEHTAYRNLEVDTACLAIKNFPLIHADVVRLVLERDFKARNHREKVTQKFNKWCKGYIQIVEETEVDCTLVIPFNEYYITFDKIIDEIDQIIQDVSH